MAVKLLDAWIADSKHREELRRSEHKYRSIFDNSAQGIFQSTPDGRLQTANRALAAINGYASPEALLADMTDLAHQLYQNPKDRDQLLQRLQESGRVSGFETRYICRDGRVIDVSVNARLVSDPETVARLIEGFVEDITTRKQAEEALQVSQDKYFEAFENSPIWVVLSSLETGRDIEVNKR